MAQAFNRRRGRKFSENCGEKPESKLMVIKERIEQIVMNMKSPMRGLQYRAKPELTCREAREGDCEMQEEMLEGIERVLKDNGMGEYTEVFRENQIKVEDLRFLNREDLVDMKIPVGPRNKILRIVDEMQREKENQIENEESIGENYKKSCARLKHRRIPSERRKWSLDASGLCTATQKTFENIAEIVREISEKNEYIIKAIEANQKAIIELRHQPGFRKHGHMSQV